MAAPALPKLKKLPVLPRGSRELQTIRKIETRGFGPGDPPPDFVTNTTSLSEWWFYWAMAKALGDPEDPRQAPFFGGRYWDYQRIYDAGAGALGTSSVDFVYYGPYERIGIRIQTYRFHIGTTPEQKGYDALQLARLGKVLRVVDVYEQDFIFDPTGQAAVVAAKRALGLISGTNPLAAGTNIFRG